MPSTKPPRRALSTIPERRAPSVVVVSPGRELMDACTEAARFVGCASVQSTDVKSVATAVARWRPFSIVVEEEVFAFDPQEFIALARDVGGEVITVPAATQRDELLTVLLPRLKVAMRRWEKGGFNF